MGYVRLKILCVVLCVTSGPEGVELLTVRNVRHGSGSTVLWVLKPLYDLNHFFLSLFTNKNVPVMWIISYFTADFWENIRSGSIEAPWAVSPLSYRWQNLREVVSQGNIQCFLVTINLSSTRVLLQFECIKVSLNMPLIHFSEGVCLLPKWDVTRRPKHPSHTAKMYYMFKYIFLKIWKFYPVLFSTLLKVAFIVVVVFLYSCGGNKKPFRVHVVFWFQSQRFPSEKPPLRFLHHLSHNSSF